LPRSEVTLSIVKKHVAALGCGTLLIVTGLIFLIFTSIPGTESATTTGTIITLPITADDNGGQSCGPVAHFTDHGQSYTTRPPTEFTDPCPYTVGQKVTVRYAPADPFDSSVPDNGDGVFFGIVAIILGVGVGIGWFVALQKNRAHSVRIESIAAE
jgi:Protein of unknown function (DUF3592)